MARSFRLNARLLREARWRLGWSQEDLASEAGLCVRVVAKAEAGGTVLLATAERIANAFQAAGVAADFLPIVGSPREAVESILQAYRLSDRQLATTCSPVLSNTLLAEVTGSRREIPFAGVYQGLLGFERLWKRFFTLFHREGGDLGENEQVAVAGQQVVLWGHEKLRIGESPAAPPLLVVMQFRVERGLVRHFELTLDPTAIACRLHGHADAKRKMRPGA